LKSISTPPQGTLSEAFGDSPVRSEFLPFHQPWIGNEERNEVLDTLESGWLTKGPKTVAFEKQFANFIGVPHAVGTNSCTAALHLALVALGVKPGDEVITTPITFAATVNVIEHCGARPVFVDVEEKSLNLNVELLEKAITSRTKAMIPVHFAGKMCHMDEIMRIAQEHGIKVIEDAAHSLESQYLGKSPGQWGDVAAFSFYATKNITTGEGGMLVAKDPELAERVAVLSLHGLSRDAWKRYSKEGYRDWEILEPGFKYHMADLEASLGIHQLRKVHVFWEKRREIVNHYNHAFQEMKEIVSITREATINRHGYHLYVIRLKMGDRLTRDQMLDRLQQEGIGVGVHFRAVHLHPYYKEKYKIPEGTLNVAEKASEEILSLPLYPRMSLKDADDVVRAVKKIIVSSK